MIEPFLADTHIVCWWYLGSARLPRPYRRLLDRVEADGGRVAISAITLWEIAKLVQLGKLELPVAIDAAMLDIEANPAIEVLPLDARIAIDSTRLGDAFPRDPADQVIAATARVYGLPLMTVDQNIRASGAVPIVDSHRPR